MIATTTVMDLTRLVLAFRDERDWAHFHLPKDVALAPTLEAAEVLELFQWRTDEAAAAWLARPDGRATLAAELADVLTWILLMAHDHQIDLADAPRAKLIENTRKYPVEPARGRAAKYTNYT